MSTLARTLLMTLLACTLQTPSIAAASGADVLADCVAGHLKAHYPAADYASALANMPADVGEYSGCGQAIALAQTRDAAATASAARAATTKTADGASAGAGAAAAATGYAGTGQTPIAAAGTQDTSPIAKPLSAAATATTPAAAEPGLPSSTDGDTGNAASMLAALPGNGGGPGSGGGNGLPAIPLVIACCVIALSGARALHWWGNRPDDDADAAAGSGAA